MIGGLCVEKTLYNAGTILGSCSLQHQSSYQQNQRETVTDAVSFLSKVALKHSRQIKTRRAMYYRVTSRRVRVTIFVVENQ
jgi:hypothetical protein